jgi:uncharacterized protein DUF5752
MTELSAAKEAFEFRSRLNLTLLTGEIAHDLREFRDGLERVSLNSISYHMFDARLRLEAGDNDFRKWFEQSLHYAQLAQALRSIDPYTHTEEGLRRRIVSLIERRLEK